MVDYICHGFNDCPNDGWCQQVILSSNVDRLLCPRIDGISRLEELIVAFHTNYDNTFHVSFILRSTIVSIWWFLEVSLPVEILVSGDAILNFD